MSCQIKIDKAGKYEVTAPNGQPSILFDTIKSLPEITSDQQAVTAYEKLHSKSFKDWYGVEWTDLGAKKKATLIKDGFLDANGEPAVFYRGDLSGLESFRYSADIGHTYGPGLYIAQNLLQAEAYAAETGKTLYPVFVQPTEVKEFADKLAFLNAVAEFHNITTVPKDTQVEAYVRAQHMKNITIAATGVMGLEYNVPKRSNVKSIFSKGFTLTSGMLYDSAESDTVVDLSEASQEARKSDQFVEELVQKIQDNLGLESDTIQHIDEGYAQILTEGAKNPWAGQAAFFYKGKIYVVEGRLDFKTAIHEFSHPLVKAISVDNNKLFNKIYTDIISTSQGQELLREAIEENPELDADSDQIKEETIVKAMTYVAVNKDSTDLDIKPNTLLGKAIDKFIYALKQLFRKLTKSPIDVKNLSTTTTVKQLSDMLINDKWSINMDVVTQEDIVSYIGSQKDLESELNEKFNTDQGIVDGFRMVDIMLKEHLNLSIEARKAKDQEALDLALASPIGGLIIDEIKSNLQPLNETARIKRKSKREQRLREASEEDKARIEEENSDDAINELRERNRIAATNFIHMSTTIDKIKSHVASLKNHPDQKEAFKQIDYYNKVLRSYTKQVDAFTTIMQENDVRSDSLIRKDISAIGENIKDTQQDMLSIVETAVSEILADQFNTYNISSVEVIEKEIAVAEKELKNAKSEKSKEEVKNRIEALKDKKENQIISPAVMRKYLIGEMGDIGMLSSQFENFISVQDPSISSLAIYVKTNGFKVDAVVLKGQNMLLKSLKPLTQQLGISTDQLKKFSDQLLFKDKSARYNSETNKIEDFEVYTFLNEHKNYKHTLAVINNALKEAKEIEASKPSKENFDKVAELEDLKTEHKKLYLRDKYVPEYYEADVKLLSTPLGREAKEEANRKYSIFEEHQVMHSELEINAHEDYETAARALADYKKLFSLYNDDGTKKEGDALKKAEMLLENRISKRKFHKYVPIKNAFKNSLQGLETKIRAQLQKEQVQPGTEEYETKFEELKDSWLARNTHAKPTDEWYEQRATIFKKIGEIFETSTGEDFGLEEKEALLEMLQGRKDDENQPIAPEMTPEMLARIKELELDIKGIKEENKEDSKYAGLSAGQQAQLNSLFELLNGLQVEQATSYYIDTIDDLYKELQKKDPLVTSTVTITPDNVDMFADPAFIASIKGIDEKFDTWFQANHYTKEVFYPTGKQVEYVRIKPWNKTVPRNPKHNTKTNILDDSGKVTDVIEGVPNMQYFAREVKDEYHRGYDSTTKKIDQQAHFDIQGYQLPKSLEEMKAVRLTNQEQLDNHNIKLNELLGLEGITYDYYINHEYNKIKAEGGPRFEILQKIKKFHHETQRNLDRRKTLGYELPRLRQDKYQYIQSGNATEAVKGAASILGKRPDDPEEDINYEDQAFEAGVDAYTTEDGSKIPIRGKYDLDIGQVSYDVMDAVFKYYKSAEQNKQLQEIQPVAEAVRDLAKNNQPQKLYELKKGQAVQVTRAESLANSGESNNREKTITGMVEVLFEGKLLSEKSNLNSLVKVNNVALGMAAHSFFALDLVSALKNYFGAQFQIGLEAIGNKYYDYKSYYRGRPWATKTMWKISNEIYKDTGKSLEVQMVDIFDADQGRFEDGFGTSPSRSITRDAANMSWMMSTRKWLQTQATLQIFASIMNYTKVEQVQPDGTTKSIAYIDAFEMDPETDTIKLKDGIDESWAPGNTNFNKIKTRNHEVSGLLQGLYAKEEQGIINRNLAYRSIGTFKKYFFKMFMHRFAASGISRKDRSTWLNPQERTNLATGQGHLGFYWEVIRTLKATTDIGMSHLWNMNASEKRAMKMMAFEPLKLYAIYLLKMLIFASFGTDDEDSERWSKIANQSGALPSPFTSDEWAEKFNMSGWTRAHLLLLLMNIETEAAHFTPAGTKDMYSVVTSNSIAMAASYENLIRIMYDIGRTMVGDDKVYYKKDGGMIKMKEKGTNKVWNKIFRIAGVNGKFAAPVPAAKTQEQFRSTN